MSTLDRFVAAVEAGLVEFVEALGVTETDLLGWSLGGIVVQAVTLQRAGRAVAAPPGRPHVV